jgi:hypothetical protein
MCVVSSPLAWSSAGRLRGCREYLGRSPGSVQPSRQGGSSRTCPHPPFSALAPGVSMSLVMSDRVCSTIQPEAGERRPAMDQQLEPGPETVHLDRDRRGHPPIPREIYRENLWRGTTRGTPQGGRISPLIANLFLALRVGHVACSGIPDGQVRVERFADDAVVRCLTEHQAHRVRVAIERRLGGVGLQLHPDETRMVYCKDDRQRLAYNQVTFTFCG